MSKYLKLATPYLFSYTKKEKWQPDIEINVGNCTELVFYNKDKAWLHDTANTVD